MQQPIAGGSRWPSSSQTLLLGVLFVNYAAWTVVQAGSSVPSSSSSNRNGTTALRTPFMSSHATSSVDGYAASPQPPPHPDKVLRRDKRYLLWPGSAVSKSVLGFTVPVETKDKVNWRTLNLAYNFQAQYVPVPTVSFPWTRFDRSLEQRKQRFDRDGHYENDGTRQFVYTAYELIMERRGMNGRQCLLRSICEAAQVPIEHTGVFDELLQLFLTPNKDDSDAVYVEASNAGKYGVECQSLYPKCPMGSGLLDSISYFKT